MIGWIAFIGTAYSVNRIVDEAKDHRPKTHRSQRNLTRTFIIIECIVLAIVIVKQSWLSVAILVPTFLAFMIGRHYYREWTLNR